MQSKLYRPFLSLSLLSLTLLSACSPHPGAGGWKATSSDATFERLEVRYNGQADFYTSSEDTASTWRCFWGVEDKQTTNLKCVEAADTTNEQTYLLLVNTQTNNTTPTRTAELKLAQQSLGHYQWQAPAIIEK